MEIISILIATIKEIFSFYLLLYLLLGTVAGIIVGAIPGLTIVMGVILVLPFTFNMTPIQGLATMIGVYVGGYSGGQISAILLGIPGTPSSISTVFDGYPMAQKGEAGLALALGTWSSFFGGLVGTIMLIFLAIPIAKIGLAFGPWEMFSLIIFGLTLIGSLSAESMIKGLIGGFLGMFLSTIGLDQVSGTPRFAFGLHSLLAGLDFLPVLIGLYAFPQMINALKETICSNSGVAKKEEVFIKGSFKMFHLSAIAVKEITRQWTNLLRSSLIGTFVGALPGAGGTISNFLAYDQAKKFSRKSEQFGKGIPDGIIASESSNNATAGGALIPTIALGIPGSAVTAIMLGVLILHGITPGPLLLRDEPVLVYGIFCSLIIAHLFMIITLILGIRFFIKITKCPKYILVPLVLMMCVVGTFALNNRIFDVWIFFIFGLMGYFLDKCKMPLTPIVLGLILGPIAEINMRRALMINNNIEMFFTRPISLTFLLLSIASIIYCLHQNRRQSHFS